MGNPESIVYIVDDDAEMRSALCRLVRTAGMQAVSFASALEFLAADHPDRPGCLLLDVQLPCMSGLELQQCLKREQINIPIIFLTGYGNVPSAVSAMKLGALDFLEKPFDNEVLLDRVRNAIQMDVVAHLMRRRHGQTGERLARLTVRELEVMDMLVSGKPNKAIAELLGVSVRTVETHRASIMAKMQADSLPDLVVTMLDFNAHKRDH